MSSGDPVGPPSAWLADNVDLLRPGGAVLDVACGRGRHALWLARAGFRVRAIDCDRDAVAFVRRRAGVAELDVAVECANLETDPPPALGDAGYDAVVVVNYLHRPLFTALKNALKPGGVLIYETFTTQQAGRGRPTNPDFLLRPGELQRLVAPLTVLRAREGEFDGRFLSSIVASRDAPPTPP